MTIDNPCFYSRRSPCRQPIKCGQTIRLMHLNTRRNLHSHHFQSPLSHNLEVSAFGENGEGDEGGWNNILTKNCQTRGLNQGPQESQSCALPLGCWDNWTHQLLSPAYEIGRGILKWRCPSVRPSVRPSFRPSVLPSVRPSVRPSPAFSQ